MDRADVRLLERPKGRLQPAARGRIDRLAARGFQRLAKAQLQLARRLLRKRHRDDAVHPGAVAGENADNARDELGGLSRASGGFDEERLVKRVGNGAAGLGIGVRLKRHNQASGNQRTTQRPLRSQRIDFLPEFCAPCVYPRDASSHRPQCLKKSATSASGCFDATRRSSSGPQTGRKSHQRQASFAGTAGSRPSSTARFTTFNASRPCARDGPSIGISAR